MSGKEIPVLDHFVLPLDKKWFRQGIVIPDCLDPKQNLFDQPPFAWVLEHTDIFPKKIFKTGEFDAGRVLLMNIYFRDWDSEKENIVRSWKTAGLDGRDRVRLLENFLRNPTQAHECARVTCQKLSDFFQIYPRIRQYYMEHTRTSYTPFGEPVTYQDLDGMIQSYSAWLRANKSTPIHRWLGLAEELPVLSTDETLQSALPPKPRINRRHRIGKSEGMK